MKLKPGQRLKSVACSTTVLVVRAPDDDVDLRCGGHPMTPDGQEERHHGPGAATPQPDLTGGTEIGKRYEAGPVEVLCVTQGAGTLTIGTTEMGLKAAKPLPSSD